MTTYQERPRRVEAMKIIGDNAEPVAAWAGGGAMAMPNGAVMLLVNGGPVIAPVDSYVTKPDPEQPATGWTAADDFERQWAPAEGE